jgi:hypothetical protein
MTKTLTALTAATAIALATMAIPTDANAGCRGCGVGAGIVGGLVAGTIIGGAIANSGPRYDGPGPAYGVPGQGYPQPVACGNGPGFWAPRQWVGRDGMQHVSERQFYWCP